MTSRFWALWSLGFCLLLTLVVPCFSSSVRICFVAAPCVLLFYNVSLIQTLWLSLFTGCFCDCFQASPKFGFLGLSFVITSWLLYDWRRLFFKDSLSTIFIMTYCYSFVLTLVQNGVALIFDLPTTTYSLRWALCDLGLMPLIDALFAWTCFALVPFCWKRYRLHLKRRKRSEEE
ncbi:MAG: hypothetical protein JSR46_04290 [Verrucomicrobia bacterium]|nr:hypothetical protein [Verrucomicrobiota bacterium]